ncbi:hypothetical protein CANCADRAFT_127309 [Tortispora caseinolytica NRRL Y-17796]|uniref:Major facilitator superfamily (MFS) profile domain-containing protein n=1 Tax=Tortispora caseinolytica NRRL Y-17796 TaxID=767744 RepID=A0A1E4TAB0_9ASCO|nr:hypothetical protein CANCADRAFT_127309 [Tortispora caseinolytica NRRL Y-17796]
MDPLAHMAPAIEQESSESTAFDRRSEEVEAFDSQSQDLEAHDEEEEEEIEELRQISSRQASIYRTMSMSGSVQSNESVLPGFGAKKSYPPFVGDPIEYEVDFTGPHDPMHPHNWPLSHKALSCISMGFFTFVIAFGSGIIASGAEQIAEEFHVGRVVAVLTVALYVVGFATGPVIWAPLSELYGRKLPLVFCALTFNCFIFGAATAKDLQTLMICRFFAGFFGACPIAVVGAAFSDVFNNHQRGYSTIVFAAAVFIGPMLAPIVGGYIVANESLGWRWTCYITGIIGSAAMVQMIFLVRESYAPIILSRKAANLRLRTGNWAIHAPIDLVSFDFQSLVSRTLTRPLSMLFTEPILLLLTIYTAFVYGILYLFLETIPVVFGLGYGWSSGKNALPYIALIIGELIGGCVCAYGERYYHKQLKHSNGLPVPEARLPPMILGGFVFPIGIFWLCWTGAFPEKVHWIVPTISGLFSGMGLMLLFLPSINYIIDAYLIFAASALAGNTFMRSGFAAAFPVFGVPMFNNLNVKWVGTIIGSFAAILAPVPIFFFIYGKRIRASSRYNPMVAIQQMQTAKKQEIEEREKLVKNAERKIQRGRVGSVESSAISPF